MTKFSLFWWVGALVMNMYIYIYTLPDIRPMGKGWKAGTIGARNKKKENLWQNTIIKLNLTRERIICNFFFLSFKFLTGFRKLVALVWIHPWYIYIYIYQYLKNMYFDDMAPACTYTNLGLYMHKDYLYLILWCFRYEPFVREWKAWLETLNFKFYILALHQHFSISICISTHPKASRTYMCLFFEQLTK